MKMKSCISSELFIIIMWPDIQEYMDKEGFRENSHLINDEVGLDKYGSSAYFVNKAWLEGLTSAPSAEY